MRLHFAEMPARDLNIKTMMKIFKILSEIVEQLKELIIFQDKKLVALA